jgi:hypothetical protein
VDCTGVLVASDVAVVVVLFFGHLDGDERAAGDPGIDDTSVLAPPRSRSGGQARGPHGRGLRYRVCVKVFLGESLAF